jgi:hypothetical protein
MNTIGTQSVTMSDASSLSTETEAKPDATVPTTAEVTVFISDELQSIIDSAINDGADAAIQTANEALLKANWLTPGIIQEIEAVFPSTSDSVESTRERDMNAFAEKVGRSGFPMVRAAIRCSNIIGLKSSSRLQPLLEILES